MSQMGATPARVSDPTSLVWSALCSELITALLFDACLCRLEKTAEDVGFYFAANVLGRLLGITLSGLLYRLAGIEGCLIGSVAMFILCWAITFVLLTAPERTDLQQTVV